MGSLEDADRPQVIFVQEHKLLTQESIDDAAAYGLSMGYTSVWTPAVPGPGQGPAGGTAILAIPQLGLTRAKVPKPLAAHPRATAGILQLPAYGRLLAFSAYGVSKLGAKGDTLDLTAYFSQLGDTLQLPFLAGGTLT